MITMLDVALVYIEHRLATVPIPYMQKGPVIPNWSDLQITRETAPHYYNGIPQNIGVVLGSKSGDLVDVDIDCREALQLAPYMLPDTCRFGRDSKRASHWLYYSPILKHTKFEDPNIKGEGQTIIELRADGVQTVFPGSTHPSGEFIDFEEDWGLEKTAQVEREKLETVVGKLAAAALLARYFPAKGRHDFCLALGGGLLRDGWTVEEAEPFVALVAWVGGSDSPRQRASTVHGTAEKIKAGEPVTGWKRVSELIADRPLGGGVGGRKLVGRARKWLPATKNEIDNTNKIQITVGFDELEIADHMISALGTLPNVYNRGYKLVQILRDSVETKEEEITREPNAPRITEMPKVRVRELVSHLCNFVRWKTGQDGEPALIQVPVPDEPVAALHARGEWPKIKPLGGIAECPVFRPNKTILDVPGYDEATGIFYEPNADFPSIPTEPTLDDVQNAIAEIYDVVQDFPFENDAHLSAWFALLLTPFARPTINGSVPIGLLNKNNHGVGGTMLAEIIGEIFSGRSLPCMPLANEDEMRKRLLALAVAGDPIVLLDNVKGTLDSQVLALTITSQTVQDRRLGISQMVPMPMRALWLVSAQNLVLSNELVRRALHVRLETTLEKPEERSDFKYDPLIPHIRNVRPKLVSAALTVLRGYFAAGSPPQKLPAWGSFEQWSNVVRGALVWAGMKDPLGGREDLTETSDSETSALERALIAWEGLGRPMLISEVLHEIQMGSFAHTELREALAELCDHPADRLTASIIGVQLKKYRRKNVGGRRFDTKPKQKHGVPWFVSRIG